MNEQLPPDKRRTTSILERVCSGDSAAIDELLPVVYSELRELAGKYLGGNPAGHTLQPTALLHEAFVRIASADSLKLNDSAHFAAVCAKTMRQVLVDHSRRKGSQKRGGEWTQITLSVPAATASENEPETIDLLALDESLSKLTELDPQQARLVEMRFFGGMTLREVAEVLEMTHTSVQRELRLAQAWLLHDMTGDL